jgi:hypothetical protein
MTDSQLADRARTALRELAFAIEGLEDRGWTDLAILARGAWTSTLAVHRGIPEKTRQEAAE